jgi:hypothetical protein
MITFYPLIYPMEKQNLIKRISIAILTLLLFGYVYYTRGVDKVQKEIWAISEKIYQLNKAKDDCQNNLTYNESVRLSQGKVRLCYERDDAIQEQEARLQELRATVTSYKRTDAWPTIIEEPNTNTGVEEYTLEQAVQDLVGLLDEAS